MKPAGFTAFTLAVGVLCSTLNAVERLPALSSAMNQDPPLASPVEDYFLPADWADLWRNALTDPEEDLRREAAIAVMRLHQRGSADTSQMHEAMLEGFRTAANDKVRLSIAAALIQLEVREAAADLYEFAASGNRTVARTVEPALARWQFQPIRDVWAERIRQPDNVATTHLVLAAHGLAAAGHMDAVPDLLRLAGDNSAPLAARLAAASALGSMTNTGFTNASRALAADLSGQGFSNRLIAASLLAGHQGEDAERLLLTLARDQRPSVAAIALRRLLEINPTTVHAVVGDLLTNHDAEVRRLASLSLAAEPSVESVTRLTKLLSDPHPDVRQSARQTLQQAVAAEHHAAEILRQTEVLLRGENWTGLEQAARLSGELDHEPAAVRLIELLDHDRMEVAVTAGWALRELAVADTLPAVHAFVLKTCDPLPANPLHSTGSRLTVQEDACLSYLFEFIGQAELLSAAPVLKKFVPKRGDMGRRSRAAAIWALGHIYANDPPEELVRGLISRMGDASILRPEYPEVRAAAAISLGRMDATESIEPMKSAMTEMRVGSREYEACLWAIARMTGRPQPRSPPQRLPPRQPFLRSIGR